MISRLLDWLVNQTWFCQINWCNQSDHAHYEHPLDEPIEEVV